MTIHAWASDGPDRAPESIAVEPGPLLAGEVELEVRAVGLCHSDVHILKNHWKSTRYPVVAGHEVVGVVTTLGADVRGVAVGDRVGVGWQCAACLACASCLRGDEHLCDRSLATAMGMRGGFADRMRVDHRFVHPIPPALRDEHAAPLLCAGATVFSPLVVHDVRPSMRFGVIGLGGLGHLAIQFARAWGCEVTAFSTSPTKEEEARRFGAHRFVATRDPAALADLAGSLDFVLSTVHADLDFAAYVRALRPNGTLCFVASPPSPVSIPAGLLLGRQRRLTGSLIAPRHRMREMLEFAARHSIAPQIERMAMRELPAAIERLERNEARYRIVLSP